MQHFGKEGLYHTVVQLEMSKSGPCNHPFTYEQRCLHKKKQLFLWEFKSYT